MEYQYSKLTKGEKKYIIIQTLNKMEGYDVRDLTIKHNEDDHNVIIFQKDQFGRNYFQSMSPNHFNDFDELESFDTLNWKIGNI